MIKIAFLIDTIETPTAGTEKQLLLLLESLSRDDFEPLLYCLRSSKWLETSFAACPLVNLNITSLSSPLLPLKILNFSFMLRRAAIDIIQTHFIDSNYVGFLAAKLAATKTLISTRRGMPYWRNALELRILRALDRATDVFVANSHWSAASYSEIEAINPTLIKVIHNGINVEDFPIDEATRAASRARIGVPSCVPIVGLVANLRPVKGIDVFLRAAALIKNKFGDVQFVVVGEGQSRNDLMSQAEGLGLNSTLKFLGQQMDIPRLLAAFDVAVLSSYSESLSNSLIEYGAAGLPVVCTDAGGSREVVVDGVNGYVVPVGDAQALADRIAKLLSMPDRKQMGLLNRKMIQNTFSLESSVRQYGELYTACCLNNA